MLVVPAGALEVVGEGAGGAGEDEEFGGSVWGCGSSEGEVEDEGYGSEDVELEGFGDELGEGQVADGPVDVSEERDDFGEVGGGYQADGDEEGDAGGDEGEDGRAEELTEGAVFEEEEGFDGNGDEGVVGFEADAEAGEDAYGGFEVEGEVGWVVLVGGWWLRRGSCGCVCGWGRKAVGLRRIPHPIRR